MKKLLAFCSILLGALSLHAQVANNTALVGTVTDAQGAVVSDAKVIGTNHETKVQYTGTTNNEGYYSIPFVNPGVYDVTIEKSGFQKVTATGVIVTINLAVRTDVTLSVGSENTEISITASTPPLSTDDALLGETVSQQQVQDLPMNGRQALSLATTASNITIAGTALTGNPPGNRLSGAGTRSVNNSISLDGISLMNNLILTATLTPNPDALDSVQTQNGNYTAQYGDYLGVHVNMVTKSGGNKFHGTVYDYIQNDALNAKSWLAPKTQKKSPLRYNQFGFVLNGPVWIPHLYNGRDKTFFLASYEGLRNTGATSSTQTVLTDAQRRGDFSAIKAPLSDPRTRVCPTPTTCASQPYPGNQIPISPVTAKLLQYLAAPNAPGIVNPTTGLTTSNWTGNLPNQVNLNSTLDRIDHNIGDKIRLFGRYAWQSVNNYTGSVNAVNTVYNATKTRNGVLGYTHIITPKLVNDARFGFNILVTNNLNELTISNQTNAGSELGIPGFTADVDGNNPGLVDMSVSGYQGISMGATNWYQDDRQLTWYDQVSYTLGKHSIMAGVSFRKMSIGRAANNNARGVFNFDTTFTGDAAAAFIGGNPSSYTSGSIPIKGQTSQWRDGFFVQDNWQVNNRLTLQYGLRYELPTVATSMNGAVRILTSDLTTLYPEVGGTSAVDAKLFPGLKLTGPSHDNIAPRVGFSYRLTDKGVVRGGGGIYYNANQLNSYTLLNTNYPFSATVNVAATASGGAPSFTLENPNVPAPTAWPGPANGNYYTAITADANMPTPRMYQWNLDVGYEVWRNAGFELQYLGSRTIHLDESWYPNQPEPSTRPYSYSSFATSIQAYRPIQGIGQIRVIHNDGYATYNGLTAILRQRTTHGLSANLSYTWSHSMDTSDSSNDGGSAMWQNHLSLDYGDSGYDIRNRFVGTVTYELPKFESYNYAIRELLGGWQANAIVDLRTGTALNITINSDRANIGNIGGTQRPNWVHGGKVTCSRATVTGSGGSQANSCIDATAYALPAAGTFGNLHRNAIHGPGVANTNFSLFKNFKIWEDVNFQLRGEAFNFFNHPNPGNPNTTFGGNSFGYITGSNSSFGSRVWQIAGKINF